MTKRLIIKQVGVIGKTGITAALEPVMHPPRGNGIDGGYPRLIDVDICTGSDHITYNKINNWSVANGLFDPFSLFDATLKRLKSVDTEATQSGLSVTTGTYVVTLTGEGTISFTGGSGYSWSTGSLTNSEHLNNQSAIITFAGNSTPASVSIVMKNDTDMVTRLSMVKQGSPDDELIINGDFTDVTSHYYDIEGWYTAVLSNNIPLDVLGWLQGFNETVIYGVHE